MTETAIELPTKSRPARNFRHLHLKVQANMHSRLLEREEIADPKMEALALVARWMLFTRNGVADPFGDTAAHKTHRS